MAEQKAASPASQRFMVGAVTTRLTVTVPAGIVGGELVRVAAPDGSYHSVVVPAGLSAGQQFSVELLAGHADSSAVELARLRVELEAERHLRRDLQQEALRSRQALEQLQQQRVRAPPPPARRPRPPRRPPGPSAHPRAAAAGGRPRVLPRLHQAPAALRRAPDAPRVEAAARLRRQSARRIYTIVMR